MKRKIEKAADDQCRAEPIVGFVAKPRSSPQANMNRTKRATATNPFIINEDGTTSQSAFTSDGEQTNEPESLSNQNARVVYLGVIKSSIGVNVLKQLAAKIANESSKRYMIIDKEQVKSVERILKCPITIPENNASNSADIRNNFTIKIYMNTSDKNETNAYPIIISGIELVKFILGDCPSFFRTSLATLNAQHVTHQKLSPGHEKAKKALAIARAERCVDKASHKFNFVRKIIRKKRIIKNRRFARQLRTPVDGKFRELSTAPITTLTVFRGSLIVTDIAGKLMSYNIATKRVEKRTTRQITNQGITCTMIAPYAHHGLCVYLGGLNGTLYILRLRTGFMKAEINVSTPIHSLVLRFSHIFVGLSSGEIVIFHRKRMTIAGVLKPSCSIIASMLPVFMYNRRRFLFAGAFDGHIYKVDIEQIATKFNAASNDPRIDCQCEILSGHSKAPRSLQIEKSRPYLYSCSAAGLLLIHNVETNCVLHRISHEVSITSVHIQTNIGIFSTSCLDGIIRLYRIEDFSLYTELHCQEKEIMIGKIKEGLLYYGTGHGEVRAIKISQPEIECKFGKCDYRFIRELDLIEHILQLHLPAHRTILRCMWSGCGEWIKNASYSEHTRGHVMCSE